MLSFQRQQTSSQFLMAEGNFNLHFCSAQGKLESISDWKNRKLPSLPGLLCCFSLCFILIWYWVEDINGVVQPTLTFHDKLQQTASDHWQMLLLFFFFFSFWILLFGKKWRNLYRSGQITHWNKIHHRCVICLTSASEEEITLPSQSKRTSLLFIR